MELWNSVVGSFLVWICTVSGYEQPGSQNSGVWGWSVDYVQCHNNYYRENAKMRICPELHLQGRLCSYIAKNLYLRRRFPFPRAGHIILCLRKLFNFYIIMHVHCTHECRVQGSMFKVDSA